MPLKSFFKIILSVTIFIILLAIALQVYVNAALANRIVHDLQKQILTSTDSVYHANVNKVSVNIFTQSISLSGITLMADRSHSTPSQPLYSFSAKTVSAENFGLIDYFKHKNFSIHALEFSQPEITIYQGQQQEQKNNGKNSEKFSLYETIQPVFNEFSAGNINITNASIMVYKAQADTTPVFSSRENNIAIKNLRIDKAASIAKRYFVADAFTISINKFSYVLAGGLYTLQAQNCETSYLEGTVTINGVKLLPNYSKMQFDDEAGQQTDRMNIEATSLKLSGMVVNLFFEKNKLIADNLTLDSLNISAFRDKNLARKPKEIASLQRVIKNIPFYTAIQKVEAKNSTIVYEEVAEGNRRAGKIVFSKLNATVTGLINDTNVINTENQLHVKAEGRFMNSGKISAEYTFPLLTDKMVFTCKGSLSGLQLTDLNQMVEPNANVKIKSGKLDRLSFNFKADDIRSTGDLTFLYHGLSIELKDKQTRKTKFKEEVLGFLVNKLVLKPANPLPGKEIRNTSINYTRNRQRFIFNYTWKSLLSGIKPAIGFPTK